MKAQDFAVLLQLLAKYGPGLIHAVADLIHGNPQLPGETEDNYLVRVNAMIDAKLEDAAKNDADVIGES